MGFLGNNERKFLMTTQASPSSEKIHEALNLLREAAKDKKDELRKTVSNQYGDLKDVLGSFGATVSEKTKAAVDCVKQVAETGQEKAKEAAKAVDESVHEKPWHYIAGVAVGALLLGYLLGRRD
jgi:ElaB/YqjD/DUF883 family membrane-anchored ribosome-binding protein